MRSLDADFITQKNAEENKPIYLYAIYDYDGSSDLFLAEYDTDITFDGQVYTRFPIKHDFISENTKGQIDAVKLTLGNVSRLIQAYLESYDLRGVKVDIIQVFSDTIADADAYLKHTYYIDSYTADEQSAEFTLTSRFDVLDLGLPARAYSRNYCGWKFKSDECGYDGAETECDKTLSRCRVLSNEDRFGGFPSIPSRQIYVR